MKRERLNYKLLFVIITLVIVLSLALTSCIGVGTTLPSWVDIFPSTSPAGSPEIQYIKLDVPCVLQGSEDWCARACIAMILRYFGYNAILEEIVYAVDNYDGWWFYGVKDYCNSRGFIAKYCYLNIDNVKYYLQEGMPVIQATNHSWTIIGYNDIEEVFIKLNPRNCLESNTKYSGWGVLASPDAYWQENYVYEGVKVQPCFLIYPK